MFNDDIDTKYKKLIKYLILNGYMCKRELKQRTYQKNPIIIQINSEQIIIKDINNNRRFYFNLDTSSTFLVNFLTFLNNNYSEALVLN